ncbi:MAG: hypothetical protein ACK5ZK_07250 [Armatimonadota bacterium]|jgi:hypothetical protein|nr:hypothetical protein [Fimbriimonadaceae bacterium]
MKRFVASITSSLAATWALAVTTGPIVFTYGGDPQVPNYWSGTNCKVEFTCSSVAAPGDPGVVEPTITGYEVIVGGELTKSWAKPPAGPNSPAVAAAIVFDSTHFGNSTLLQVEIKVHTTDKGTITMSSPPKLVKNRARLLTQKDFLVSNVPGANIPATNADTVQSLDQANYTVGNRFNSTWLKGELRQDLLTATVFSIITHGNVGEPGTRFADNGRPTDEADRIGLDPETWRFYAHLANHSFYSVESARIQGTNVGGSANPTFLPPYNSGEPPCTMAYIGACLTGSDATILAKFTWPVGTRYIPEPPSGIDLNEALVGYKISVSFPGIALAEGAFWQLLMDGKTAVDTLDAILDCYAIGGVGINGAAVTGHVSVDPDDVALLGDPLAKSKGVYGGELLDWWREVL